jgi:hypothetical protein
MSYRLRVYASNEGVQNVTVTLGNYSQKFVPGSSDSVAGFDDDELTSDIKITATIRSGYSLSRWVVDKDGTRSYKYTTACSLSYSTDLKGVTDVQIRLEVEDDSEGGGGGDDTYTTTVRFDANGGTGAPGSITETGSDQYVYVFIPNTVPTRSGYAFAYWMDVNGSTYSPGSYYLFYGTTSGYTWTLTAVWTKVDTGGHVYLYNGSSWVATTPYIYNGSSWVKVKPYLYNGSAWVPMV